MIDHKLLAKVAADCLTTGTVLAPFQNRGKIEVVNADLPPAPILREMMDRINAIRAEYGLPPLLANAMLASSTITDITSTLLSAGNLLMSVAREPKPDAHTPIPHEKTS